MLEKVNLSQKLDKATYNELMDDLEIQLGELQREIQKHEIPVIVVFQGWDAAGKGTLINRLLLSLDPRGYKVHPTNAPNEEERLRPFLWRFWINTPERGMIAIFDRSWYGRVLIERIDKLVKKNKWQQAYFDINDFEKQLTDDGAVIIKFFLHISQKEQKKRFNKLLKNSSTSWKVTEEDWKHHKQYDEYVLAVEEMLQKTSTANAPWTIVESHDRRFATVKVFQSCLDALKKAIQQKENVKKSSVAVKSENAPIQKSVLDTCDLSLTMDRETYKEQLKYYQKKLFDIEHEVYLQRIPVIIVYQGWDAGGKGGNIRRLVNSLDPRGYEVIPVAAPNDVEKAHHYLWRFWKQFPKAGHIVIFDRSWYGRVMVERVEGFCSQLDWQRAYAEINSMESQWARFGAVIFKFWLHIDQNEQLKRFESRQQIPHKQWKITDEDWRNREKWNQYKEAVDEMLIRTSTPHAPWTVVEANSKLFARIKVLKLVAKTLKSRLK